MQHFASVTAFVLVAIMASSAAPLPTDQEMMARDCEVKTNTGGLSRRCVRWINAGLVAGDPAKRDSVGIANGDHDLKATFQGAQLPSLISARDSVGIANDDTDVTASFRGARLPSVISARDADTNIGVGNDATNSDLDFSGVDFSGLTIKANKRGDVGILNDATGDYNFNGATFGDIIGSEHVNRRGDVGILNGASGDYDFDGATFGPIIGSEHVNRRDDGDVGVKNGATGGGDYSNTVWGPQVGDRYIGYSTVSRRDDGDVGVKNGATGGGDYSNTVWGPQVGDRYIGYSTVSRRDGNNDADPCPGVPVGPSVGTTYMPTHPSTNYKRCSSTPIAPTDGGIVYTRRDDPPQLVSPQQKADAEAQGPDAVKQLKNQAGAEGSQIAVDRTQDALSAAGMKRDGNNDADPCPGVPVGPSVGTTYMPTHPSTNNKRCSSTPIAPTDGGIVYTRRDDPPQLVSPQQKADAEAQGPDAVKQLKNQAGAEGSQIAVDRTQDALSAAGMRRDGNNDADPCPGVPVGPSVGTTYMPTHPSTNYKRCSSTPIAPTDGGIVYTRDSS